jgi:hypothetical protein
MVALGLPIPAVQENLAAFEVRVTLGSLGGPRGEAVVNNGETLL